MKIGYARVSTPEQNLSSQIKILKEAGCEKIFTDQLSAVRVVRPGLDQALNISRPGDVLVVSKLDRLGRRTVDLLDFVKVLEDKGVSLESISDGIDPSSAMGRAMFTIASVFAELERDLILERTHAGISAAKANGVKFGPPEKLSDEQVKAASRLLKTADDNGEFPSMSSIAQVFNVDKSTLSRRLKKLDAGA
ncbi:recombinase family protein [Kiloniella laminariae]|uniref:Recombinase family protein n=1 Tax=Kiloniella laminariae TaxID=454162 RepID=A0ABT4LQH6_9PROT|nr:recombinase family protein [Kiloniella laminariae]MCZ4283140.1 recombinase family protein [Kiloniella laminariae]